ncbi:uncharacterized protein LOC142784511 [Rhipicephalus microplus]|uniref:uncharacterized protein LOC142784511 n=1 Tax=Rhipicephalus microplus TaxID=6941 RepID=UPI003F6AFCFD
MSLMYRFYSSSRSSQVTNRSNCSAVPPITPSMPTEKPTDFTPSWKRKTRSDEGIDASIKDLLGSCFTFIQAMSERQQMVLPGILVAAVFIGGAAAESTPQPWMAAMAHVQCAPPCHPLMRTDTPDTLLELRTGHMTAWRGALPDPPYEADKRKHLGRRRLG